MDTSDPLNSPTHGLSATSTIDRDTALALIGLLRMLSGEVEGHLDVPPTVGDDLVRILSRSTGVSEHPQDRFGPHEQSLSEDALREKLAENLLDLARRLAATIP